MRLRVGPGPDDEDLRNGLRALNGRVGWAVNYFWRTMASDLDRCRNILAPHSALIHCPRHLDVVSPCSPDKNYFTFSKLPDAVKRWIIKWFDPVFMLVVLIRVSKEWRELIETDALWEQIYRSTGWQAIDPDVAMKNCLNRRESKMVGTLVPRQRNHGGAPLLNQPSRRGTRPRRFQAGITSDRNARLDSLLLRRQKKNITKGPWFHRFRRRFMWESHHSCPDATCSGCEESMSICPVIYGFPSDFIIPAIHCGLFVLGMDHVPTGEWKLPGWTCKTCRRSWITYPWEKA